MTRSGLPESPVDGFVVGEDLVEFHRDDCPIYLTLQSRWAEAGLDYRYDGAPLDRLFGEPDEVVIVGTSQPTSMSVGMPPVSDDALVVMDSLSDGLALPAVSEPASSPDIAAIYEFSDGSPGVIHISDGWEWEQAGTLWSFDHLA